MDEPEPFKQCSICGTVWQDIRDFVVDPELRVEGYQACFVDVDLGLVLCTHLAEGCKTTLAVRVSSLAKLHDGPVYEELRKGLEDCLRLCLDRNRLEECTAECAMAWVRKVIQWLRRHELPPHMQEA